MNQSALRLKQILIKEGIVKIRGKDEEPFIINERGVISRVFFDIKEASLNPIILSEISYQTRFLSIDFSSYDKIGSIAVGGIPISTAISLVFLIPQVIIRSTEHNRGTKSSIIGDCTSKKILFIEDVSVTGASIVKGVNAIRAAGGICNGCIVVVDRQEGAEQNCLENGINLYSLLKKSDFGISDKL